jgi:hypothetical protein
MPETTAEGGEPLAWIAELVDHPVSTAIARRPGGDVERRREVAAGVAVISCAWVALGSHRQDAPAPQAQFVGALPAAVAPTQTAGPAPPTPADTVELTVRVWPPTAQITINDDKVMGNPYVGHFKREPRMLKVRAAARG